MGKMAQRNEVKRCVVTLSPCHLVTLSLLLAAGCGWKWPGTPNSANAPKLPTKVKDPNLLFAQNCAGCHGADGKGGPAPPLNDALFLAIVPDEDLLMTISAGRRGTPMPAFSSAVGGPLMPEQVGILAEDLKKRWGNPGTATKGVPDYEPPDEEGDPKAGAAVFARACAGCHGADGKGGKVAGAVNQADFLALTSDQALRRIVITGRPDFGMPRFDEPGGRPKDFKPLTAKDVNDVVALLASWRPSGPVQGK
jgi:mono/diheme cytochrome c family protein